MPIALPRPCGWPGCPGLVTESRERFCEVHKREYDDEYDRARPPAARRGYGAAWRRLRRAILAERPLCEECLKLGRIVPATEVHHIVPLRLGGTNDPSNLQALCKPCHSRKTMRESGMLRPA